MALYLFVFTALCLVTAMYIRIRDLEAEKEMRAGTMFPPDAPSSKKSWNAETEEDDSGIQR